MYRLSWSSIANSQPSDTAESLTCWLVILPFASVLNIQSPLLPSVQHPCSRPKSSKISELAVIFELLLIWFFDHSSNPRPA